MIIFDTENGRDPKAAAAFIKALSDEVINSTEGCDVTIIVGNIQFKAYDHAALIQGLHDAVLYYQSEIEA